MAVLALRTSWRSSFAPSTRRPRRTAPRNPCRAPRAFRRPHLGDVAHRAIPTVLPLIAARRDGRGGTRAFVVQFHAAETRVRVLCQRVPSCATAARAEVDERVRAAAPGAEVHAVRRTEAHGDAEAVGLANRAVLALAEKARAGAVANAGRPDREARADEPLVVARQPGATQQRRRRGPGIVLSTLIPACSFSATTSFMNTPAPLFTTEMPRAPEKRTTLPSVVIEFASPTSSGTPTRRPF